MLVWAMVLWIGCGARQQGPVVARVGDTEITEAKLRGFAGRIPDGFHKGKRDAEADSALLEALVDKTLLLLEAAQRRLADGPEFVYALAAFGDQEVLQGYIRLKVDGAVALTEEEIKKAYRQDHWDRALRLAAIVVASEEKAFQVLDELEHGTPFRQLVEVCSVDTTTRARGGETGKYLRRDRADENTALLFDLAVGTISEPLPVKYEGKRHYALFKILAAVAVPLDDVKATLEEDLLRHKRVVRKTTLTDSLVDAYNPRLEDSTVGVVARLAAQSLEECLTEAELTKRLATYNGGELRVGAFLSAILRDGEPSVRRQLADSAWVSARARELLISRILLAEAYGLGLGEDEELKAKVEDHKEDLLLSRLRRLAVDEHIVLEPQEARGFFDDNPEKFLYIEEIVVGEVLLPSVAEALRVKTQLEQGADIAQLVKRYGTRLVHGENKGIVHLDIYRRIHFPHIYDLAKDFEVGDVGGPLALAAGYSVFKLIERRPARPKPFNAASQKRAAAFVKIGKAKEGYVAFVRDLRQQYGVTIFAERIPRMVKDGKFSGEHGLK